MYGGNPYDDVGGIAFGVVIIGGGTGGCADVGAESYSREDDVLASSDGVVVEC
jgi:hypothetical protein